MSNWVNFNDQEPHDGAEVLARWHEEYEGSTDGWRYSYIRHQTGTVPGKQAEWKPLSNGAKELGRLLDAFNRK